MLLFLAKMMLASLTLLFLFRLIVNFSSFSSVLLLPASCFFLDLNYFSGPDILILFFFNQHEF